MAEAEPKLETNPGAPVPNAPAKETDSGKTQLELVSIRDPEKEGASVEVLVNIKPPKGERTPVHICCVVDVSGSMGSSADVSKEKTGLTLLDITKHAVKTILHLLGPNDVVSLVTYSDNAEVIFQNEKVTKNNLKKLNQKLETLCPTNSTNIWAGLLEGMNCIRRAKDPNRQSSIILLTDGLPNQRPPRGEQAMLKKEMDKYPDLHFSLNTIGFGYSLDSPLLIDLAKIGHGTYAFIPDSGLAGTVYVNLCSNLLSTLSPNVVVSLEPSNDAKITKVHGAYSSSMQSWGWQGHLGPLTYGQPRSVVVEMECPNGTEGLYLTATVQGMDLTADLSGAQEKNDAVIMEKFRLKTAETILGAVAHLSTNSGARDFDKLPEAQKMVEDLLKEITASGINSDRMNDLILDVSKQITEAFSKQEWYEKWGRHYLPSIARAHLYQQCNNFKDPGVQHYGGQVFQEIRDVADEIFVKLPAPKPSKKIAARNAAPVNMARSYYSRSNPCFDGGNRVEMADGSFKLVRNCQKGDEVRTCKGSSKIRCVVKTIVSPETELCELPSGLLLTPWHPVRIKGEWVFPSSVSAITTRKSEAVFSFILESHHSMYIESTEAVTLGHNFKDNDVIRHPYFGSQAVIKDLSGFEGWKDGLITFENECLERNENTGLLFKFKPEKALLAS